MLFLRFLFASRCTIFDRGRENWVHLWIHVSGIIFAVWRNWSKAITAEILPACDRLSSGNNLGTRVQNYEKTNCLPRRNLRNDTEFVIIGEKRQMWWMSSKFWVEKLFLVKILLHTFFWFLCVSVHNFFHWFSLFIWLMLISVFVRLFLFILLSNLPNPQIWCKYISMYIIYIQHRKNIPRRVYMDFYTAFIKKYYFWKTLAKSVHLLNRVNMNSSQNGIYETSRF